MCLSQEMKCDDGECINKLWKCDGEINCRDGSDEVDCGKIYDHSKKDCGCTCYQNALRSEIV